MFEVLTNKACEPVLISLADATRILETIILSSVWVRLETLFAKVASNYQTGISVNEIKWNAN